MRMRILIICFSFSLLLPMEIFTQSLAHLQSKIDSLQQVRQELEQQLQSNRELIQQYQSRIRQLKYEQHGESYIINTKGKGYLLAKPDPISDILSRIPPNTSLQAINYSGRFWKAVYKDTVGFISDFFIESDESQKEYFLNQSDRILQAVEKFLRRKIIDTLYVNYIEIDIYSHPDQNRSPQRTFQKGDKLYSVEDQNNWYHVLYDPPNIGELANVTINHTDTTAALLALFSQGWVKKSDVQTKFVERLGKDEKRRELYIENHPDLPWKYKVRIRSGSVAIGMNKEMVIASLGKPNDVNRTVYSFGVHEQWIYGGMQDRRYLYFEDGVLKSWQD